LPPIRRRCEYCPAQGAAFQIAKVVEHEQEMMPGTGNFAAPAISLFVFNHLAIWNAAPCARAIFHSADGWEQY